MSSPNQFDEVLREWAEVFTHRSMREFMSAMRDTGLSMPQLSTLLRLHHEGGCAISEVGGHLGVTAAAASQLVERLVKSGLLERTERPGDRRVRELTLTDEGRALIQRGIEARLRWMQDLTTELSPDRQAAIVKALTYLTGAAKKLEPQNPKFSKE